MVQAWLDTHAVLAEFHMHGIIYIVGLIVVILAVLSFFGLVALGFRVALRSLRAAVGGGNTPYAREMTSRATIEPTLRKPRCSPHGTPSSRSGASS